MTRTAVRVVEDALDQYVSAFGTRGVDPSGVRCRTLATIAKVSVPTMSRYLQDHRQRGGERYVVACQQYGAKRGRWKILAKPGSDPKVVQKARVNHTVWIAEDAARRLVKDIAKEIAPGMKGTAWDRVIEKETLALTETTELAVRRLEREMAHLNGDTP